MANKEHLEILKKGVEAWNEWRENNPDERPDLSIVNLEGANLSGANLKVAYLRGANLKGAYLSLANLRGASLSEADLRGADLRGADLSDVYFEGANLEGANLSVANLSDAYLRGANLKGAYLRGAYLSKARLWGADFSGADLSGADLREAYLKEAALTRLNLRGADLRGADLKGIYLNGAFLNGAYLMGADLGLANLSEADLRGADLSGANLQKSNFRKARLNNSNLMRASLIETNLENTDLTGCCIYGISAWDVKLNKKTRQKDLIITPERSSIITVDNLEVAQFIYLLLHNEKIRHVIDTITTKVVLILGRFTPERKAILDTIKEELRDRDYIPVLVDFQPPRSRDVKETVSTLAHMARFIIADITDARSIPQELQAIVPNLPSVPVQPLLQSPKDEYELFKHFKSFHWVLPVYCYRGLDDLMATLKEKVIVPAEAKVLEVRSK